MRGSSCPMLSAIYWGVSSRRMLQALAAGETDAAKLAALADRALRATPEQLQEALSAASTLGPLHRQVLGLFLSRLEVIESHMEILDRASRRRWPTSRMR